MDKDKMQEVVNYLNKKSAKLPCSACNASEWQLISDEFLIPINQEGAFTMPPKGVPSIGLICTRCGNIRFHSSVVVGVREASK